MKLFIGVVVMMMLASCVSSPEPGSHALKLQQLYRDNDSDYVPPRPGGGYVVVPVQPQPQPYYPYYPYYGPTVVYPGQPAYQLPQDFDTENSRDNNRYPEYDNYNDNMMTDFFY